MTIAAMKQALEALETEQALRHGYSYLGGVRIVSTADEAINALRAAIQQAEADAQAVATEPVWFHKHWCDGDDIFYRPDDRIPPGSTPLYAHSAPCVPEGFALVPLKATPKVAMVLYEGARSCFSPKVAEDLWQDALTAAQAQKGGE